MPNVMLNGQPVPENEALIHVSDRGARFGDGVFDTIRVHSGGPWRLSWHLERLQHGLDAIHIPFQAESLRTQCVELLKHNSCTDGLLRVQVTRGSSGQGYLPAGGRPTTIIETFPLPPLPDKPVGLWLSSYRRIPESSLPVHSKLCQGLNSTLARMEARDHGCFEALQLNQQSIIAETSSGNIFWQKQNTLFTPALDCGVLDGATRNVICQLSDNVHTVHAALDDLKNADAVCITNVAWGALPVVSLQPSGVGWKSQKLADNLNELLVQDMSKNSKSLE